ncbi:hypothetical protein DOE78_05550 [Bacillus sp. Y1]|nr:hypothetical protein DOE78_05550 [Bacillus sp. Y1]
MFSFHPILKLKFPSLMCLEWHKPIQEKDENIDISTVTSFSESVFNRKSYTILNSLRGGERK